MVAMMTDTRYDAMGPINRDKGLAFAPGFSISLVAVAACSARLAVMQEQLPALIITVDGPAGSGKSSVARALAKRLDLQLLDTGAMYRGIAVACLDRGIDPSADESATIELARCMAIRFDWTVDPPRLYVDDQDVAERIRDEDVGSAASKLAVIGEVRNVLVHQQQQIAREQGRVVSEGRDQGSVAFPDAHVKFYLDATPEKRAHRRVGQLAQLGIIADQPRILADIIERDRRDANRANGPLVCPDDAIRADTSELTERQVIDLLEHHVRRRIAEQE